MFDQEDDFVAVQDEARGRFARRARPFCAAPRALWPVLFVTELIAAVWLVVLAVDSPPSGHTLGAVGFVSLVAIGFEEIVARASRLQLRLSEDLKRDMTSVWVIAGAVALEPVGAALLVIVIFAYTWFRQNRPAGHAPYKKLFNVATSLLACLTAGEVHTAMTASMPHLPWAFGEVAAVVVAILVCTAVNRSIVTLALVVLGARGRILLGTRDDNLIELATLCLGGLVALAISYQPALVILVIAPMITMQRGALVRALEAAAMTDSKTGLLNAVAWEQLAQRELVRAGREKASLAVLVIDIDRFKLVNDQHGHLAGDLVLRAVGKTLTAAVREYDGVGRFGGEEFVAVLPDAGDVDALVVAERIRSLVHELRISALLDSPRAPLADETADRVAVSIGVSCSPIDGTELSELLVAADAALYRAKTGGRNRVVLAERGTGNSFSTALHS